MQSASLKLESSKRAGADVRPFQAGDELQLGAKRVLHEIVVPLLGERDAFVRSRAHPLEAGAALHEQPNSIVRHVARVDELTHGQTRRERLVQHAQAGREVAAPVIDHRCMVKEELALQPPVRIAALFEPERHFGKRESGRSIAGLRPQHDGVRDVAE